MNLPRMEEEDEDLVKKKIGCRGEKHPSSAI